MANVKKKPIKLNDEQLMLDASNVADIYHQLTLDLFDQVIDRIKERGSASLNDNPYIWQLEKMNEMGLLNEDNINLISERSGIAEEQLRYVIQNEGYKVYKDTKEQLLESMGGEFTHNSLIQTNLAAYVNQTMGDIDNLINTTLPMSVRKVYQSIVQESVAKVVTGLTTSDKAISETVMKWADKGFYGFTDSQGKHWKADTYARQVIKSTAWRVYREVRTAPAEEMGIDTFYYHKKATAREMCAPLQHQIVTTGVAREVNGERVLALADYGYGHPAGCQGINCTHEMTPYIPGVNYKPDLPDHLKDLTPEEAIANANVQAKQRALERSIRKSKELLHVAEKLGDSDLISKYKSRVRMKQGAMRGFLSQHPYLHRNYAREKYYDDPFTQAKKEIKVRKELEKLEKHRAEQKEIRKRFTNAMKDGIIKAEINEQKQAAHIKGTNEWYQRLEDDLAKGKKFKPSYLTISMDEAAKLIKRYAGTGEFKYSENDSYIPRKEIIKHNKKIGVYIDQKTGEMFETDSFRIHYRNTGAHIVPTLKRRKSK